MHRHRILCHSNIRLRLQSVVPHSWPSVSVAEEELSVYGEDILHAPVTYTDMEYERSISQFVISGTRPRRVCFMHLLNSFSVCVMTSLLARETVLRQHWSAECF